MINFKKLPAVPKHKKGFPWTEETNPELYKEKQDWPKISIVTPSYNQGQFIEETIRSVLLQNYPNLEYFIIDGGSTGNTIDIIKKYEKHITYWVSEADEGQAHAINKGIEKCTGDVFNWLNSDDYLEKDALYHIGKTFVENRNTEVVCGFCRIFGKPDGDKLDRMFVGKDEKETFFRYLINQPATFWKLEQIYKIGGINQSINYVFDLELWWKYIAEFGQNNVVIIDDLIAHFRFHQTSKSGNESEKFYSERVALYLHLLKSHKAPEYLIELLPKKQNKINFFYNYSKSNYITYDDVFLHFAKKLYMKLNAKGKYHETKFIIKQLCKNNMFEFNFQNIKLLIKYFVIPQQVIKKGQ